MTLTADPAPLKQYDKPNGCRAIMALSEVRGERLEYVEASRRWDCLSDQMRTTVTDQHRRLWGGF